MKYTPILFLLFFLVSCSPKLHYLRDSFPPTTEIDVFYSRNDIQKKYDVIGKLEGEKAQANSSILDEIKEAMIEEAKQKGANGIIFKSPSTWGKSYRVKADLIRYTD